MLAAVERKLADIGLHQYTPISLDGHSGIYLSNLYNLSNLICLIYLTDLAYLIHLIHLCHLIYLI